jgi:hypothetical protein
MATTVMPSHIRAYQREMFEQSLKGNRIIVVSGAEFLTGKSDLLTLIHDQMDTGSGKTQVYVSSWPSSAELGVTGLAERF